MTDVLAAVQDFIATYLSSDSEVVTMLKEIIDSIIALFPTTDAE